MVFEKLKGFELNQTNFRMGKFYKNILEKNCKILQRQ
jgi:hypothetical protein